MVDILSRITELRTNRGWSEFMLAEKSGLTQSTISTWYRKHINPTIPSLEKICTAFGITLAQFFSIDEECCMLTTLQKELIRNTEHLTEDQLQSLIQFLETL